MRQGEFLFHHDARNYQAAAADAAERARKHMDELIQRGLQSSQATLEQVERERPKDLLMGHQALRFRSNDTDTGILLGNNGHELRVHRHALQQMSSRAGIPKKYVDNMIEEGQSDLLADNLNRRFHDQEKRRFLVRTVDEEVRGFLSDRYRRMDSVPIIQSFAEAIGEVGAVVCDGKALPTKFYLRAIIPQVYEPVEHMVMCFTVCLTNSDFGDGALSLVLEVLRLWCTNYAKTNEGLRRVHLGARLGDDIAYSEKTYRLDTQTMASATKDVVKEIMAPANIQHKIELIQQASEEKIKSPGKFFEALQKASKITKGEVEELKNIHTDSDVEVLPPGNTKLRMSQAIAALARTADPYRAIELQQLAGNVAGLDQEAPKAA